MHACRAAGEGHVEAIVHDDARRAAARQYHDLLHQVHQRRGLEIPLPDLQIVDACIDGMARLLEETPPQRADVRCRRQSTAIGDELQDQGSTCESV